MKKKLVELKKKYIDRYRKNCYSQEGEDIILNELFNIKNGFFVDVGAHEPHRFSNTYLLYKKGWRGINIDPLPKSKQKFDRVRPRDINVEVGISKNEDELTYYMFDEPALNGFSKEISYKRNAETNYKIIGEKKIKTYPLAKILLQYLPKNQTIDVLNIDVEGLDLEVLQSNDWDLFKPKVILVECLDKDIENIFDDPIYKFLKNHKYSFIAKTTRTCFFRLQ